MGQRMITWNPHPAFSFHIFVASFASLPMIGEWHCARRTVGYTLDWLWWSIGYSIDITCPRPIRKVEMQCMACFEKSTVYENERTCPKCNYFALYFEEE